MEAKAYSNGKQDTTLLEAWPRHYFTYMKKNDQVMLCWIQISMLSLVTFD